MAELDKKIKNEEIKQELSYINKWSDPLVKILTDFATLENFNESDQGKAVLPWISKVKELKKKMETLTADENAFSFVR